MIKGKLVGKLTGDSPDEILIKDGATVLVLGKFEDETYSSGLAYIVLDIKQRKAHIIDSDWVYIDDGIPEIDMEDEDG